MAAGPASPAALLIGSGAMQEFLTAIQSLGFPIAACAACAWYVKYITDQNNTRMDQLNAQHRDEIGKVTEALNNNTLALQHITDVLALGGYNADSARES